jgi:hypothetical protein
LKKNYKTDELPTSRANIVDTAFDPENNVGSTLAHEAVFAALYWRESGLRHLHFPGFILFFWFPVSRVHEVVFGMLMVVAVMILDNAAKTCRSNEFACFSAFETPPGLAPPRDSCSNTQVFS